MVGWLVGFAVCVAASMLRSILVDFCTVPHRPAAPVQLIEKSETLAPSTCAGQFVGSVGHATPLTHRQTLDHLPTANRERTCPPRPQRSPAAQYLAPAGGTAAAGSAATGCCGVRSGLCRCCCCDHLPCLCTCAEAARLRQLQGCCCCRLAGCCRGHGCGCLAESCWVHQHLHLQQQQPGAAPLRPAV